MKIIQITDLHIVPKGEQLWGLSPSERLRAAVDDINSNHGDAAQCIVTGDLVNKGQVAAYEELQQALAPLNLPVHLLLGNHDDRGNFCHVFPEAQRDDHGFVQGRVETGSGVLLFLDTHEPGVAWGSYCDKRLAWLQHQLERQRGRLACSRVGALPRTGIRCTCSLPMERFPLRNALLWMAT